MTQTNEQTTLKETLSIDSRSSLVALGIVSVLSYDERLVLLKLADCELAIRGEGFHIKSFDAAKTRIELTGTVHSLEYGNRKRQGSLISKLLR